MSDPNITTAPIPRSFLDYLRSFGPGFVVVITWLGAGDIVDMGVAGGNYGYSLMWVLVLAVMIRFLFVSLIAKYQLCNQHGEGVLDGLARLHRAYAPLLLVAAVVMGHVYGSYMTVGIGEACKNVTGRAEIWQWAVLWNGIALMLVFRPAYLRLEVIFKFFLALLALSLLGTAIWVGPDVTGILQGLVRFGLPEQVGKFNPTLVAVAMIGAIGGSLMNLVYPYFLEGKGWRGPRYRRVQLYDFLLAVLVMIVLDLAIWTLGAELLYPDQTIETMDDLPRLLSQVLGPGSRLLFYAGIFSAVFTSLVGHAIGLAYMGSHAFLRWRAGSGPLESDFRQHYLYRWIVVWCLVSPLIWTAPGMPDFVTLTLVANSLQVVLLPLICGGLWCITARTKYIGAEYRNRWWENLFMALLMALALFSAVKSVESVRDHLSDQKKTAVGLFLPGPEIHLHHQDRVHVSMGQNRNPQIPPQGNVRHPKGQSHAGSLHHPGNSPVKMNETEYDRADHDSQPPRHFAARPQLRKPVDQKRPIDNLFTKRGIHIDRQQGQDREETA